MKCCKESLASAYHLLKAVLFSIVGASALILTIQTLGIDFWHGVFYAVLSILCLLAFGARLIAFVTDDGIDSPIEDLGVTSAAVLCLISLALDIICLWVTVRCLYDPADLVHLIFYSSLSTLFAISIIEDSYLLSLVFRKETQSICAPEL